MVKGVEICLVWFKPKEPVLGDDVDDPADTGPVTDCECKDCAEVLEEQTAAADAEILKSLTAEVTA
jgi:hypothetical protein